MIISAVVGGLIGAAGTVAGAYISKPDKPSSKPSVYQMQAALQQHKALQESQAYNELAMRNRVNMEQARIGLFGNLGEIGTYEKPFTAYRQAKPRTANSGYASLFNTERASRDGYGVGPDGKPRDDINVEGPVLDPTKLVNYYKNTRQYRALSAQVARADDIARQEGPEWETLQRSVLGGISEGAAALARETSQYLAEQIAKGGSARNQGMANVMKIRNQEQINRDKQQALWQSNLALRQWGEDNLRTTLGFAQAWVDNLGGVRDIFGEAMTNLYQFYGNTVLPHAVAAADSQFDASIRSRALEFQMKSIDDGYGEMVAGISNILGSVVASGLNSWMTPSARNPGSSGALTPINPTQPITAVGGALTPIQPAGPVGIGGTFGSYPGPRTLAQYGGR
jgi:hypothetical protein